MGRHSWFVKRDVDGFFGLGLDNLIQFILIGTFCQGMLGMPQDLVVHRIFPGAALSIVFGNVFYSWQAHRLARRTGRTDVTALPYGINTVTLLAYVFFILQPVYQQTGDANLTWKVGLLACFLSGVIETLGALVAGRIRRWTPRAALLSALAGVAVTFISMDFLFRIYERPWIAMLPMILILAQYFSRVRYPLGVPGGLVAVALGVLLYGILGPGEGTLGQPGVRYWDLTAGPPLVSVQPLWDLLRSEHLVRHLSIIVPMGILNVVGSLQNIESAEAAGDSYSTLSSLLANGAGSVVAACFGSCFPTTIYIGHPGWKAMGARVGYSMLNGAFVGFLAFTGAAVWVVQAIPLEAGLGILLWIGIVICAQAFEATPRAHAPAVAFGLFPSLGAWGLMMLENGLRSAGSSFLLLAAGLGTSSLPFLRGMLALSQGFLFSSMFFAAIAVSLIEKDFLRAALWSLVAAACAWLGLIHAYEITAAGVRPVVGWGVASVYGANYLLFSVVFMILFLWGRWGKGKGPSGVAEGE